MDRFFFVHVQKTGGTTLWMHVRENFPIEAVYPNRYDDPDLLRAYLDIEYMTSQPEARIARTRCFAGHVPYFVTERLAPEFTTLTVLRDPIDRVVSLLKEEQRALAQRGREVSLDEAYEEMPDRGHYVENHATKLFGARPDAGFRTFMEITLDDRALGRAKRNLERIDVLGLHESYDDFLDELRRRFGWKLEDVGRHRVGQAAEVSSALRRRIVADNEADLALYEHARRLVQDGMPSARVAGSRDADDPGST
jgi:hypothetical protein